MTAPTAKSDSKRVAAVAMRSQPRAWVIVAVTFMLAIGTYYVLPAGVNELARRAAAIFVVAAIFWATEVIPLFATSLLLVAFEIFFLAHDGGLAGWLPAQSAFPLRPDGAGEPLHLDFKTFLEPFSSSIIILFMGGFLLSAAVSKTALDRVIAARVLRPFASRPMAMLFAVMGITAFFSMWMSNTATAAMMIAIIMPLVRDVPPDDRFHRGLVLGVAFGANIGGIGTPIGTPPNAVGMAILRDAGIDIGFVDWMLIAVPLELLMLGVAGFLLYFSFRPRQNLTLNIGDRVAPMNRQAWMAAIVLAGSIVLWLTGKWHGLNPAVVALSAAAALAALGVLSRHDVDTIDWNILILMWGGLSLGNAMQETGLVDTVTQLPISAMHGFPLAASLVVIAVTLSTFMSNTAAANLLIPMAIGLAASRSEQMELGVLTALACSFAMAMPVSTPPNAIAFGTGDVPVRSMMRLGALISLISVAVLLLGFRWLLPMMLPLA